MDYMKFVNYHREMNADITVACLPNSEDRAKDFGLMKIDDKRRIVVRRCWRWRCRLGRARMPARPGGRPQHAWHACSATA